MTKRENPLRVVAGILRNEDGGVLLAQRTADRHLAGMWEFPGGKCEPGESAEAALHRELHEELAVRVLKCSALLTVPWNYPEHSIELIVFKVSDWDGEPQSCEDQALRWLPLAAIEVETLAPADRPVLTALLAG